MRLLTDFLLGNNNIIEYHLQNKIKLFWEEFLELDPEEIGPEHLAFLHE